MRLVSLTLRQFRNTGEQTLAFSPGKNLILGKNGQGKTNLLEALYFLAHTRSHRTASDRELIRSGESQAAIEAVVTPHRFESHARLEARMSLDAAGRLKTLFRLNASPVRSRSQMLGHLPAVSFFNTDLLLLRGSPGDRRRWLDAAVVQYDRRHFDYLTDYHKVKIQKNRLLKEPRHLSPAHLDVWNRQLAATAAKVMVSRLQYLGLLHDPAIVQYLELAGGQEPLDWQYLPSFETVWTPEIPVAELEPRLLDVLEKTAPDEIARQTCLVGPHRDDIRFDLGGLDACAYASQGQQRTLVLALKLTELALLSGRLGEPPVLLLDDVMAELDPDRQQYLMDRLDPEIQVFLTTTHLDPRLNPVVHRFAEEQSTAVFGVEGGCTRNIRTEELSR